MVSAVGLGAGVFIYVFYHVVNALLQFAFYARDASSTDWKIQPQKGRQSLGAFARVPFIPWLALLAPSLYASPDGTPRRPRWALVLSTFNALMAAAFAGAVGEAAYRGATRLYWDEAPSVGSVVFEFAASTALQCVLEYYWHVLMHTRWCYRHMHKIHHSNKAPEPFDDMLIHPGERGGQVGRVRASVRPLACGEQQLIASPLAFFCPSFCLTLQWRRSGTTASCTARRSCSTCTWPRLPSI